MKKIIFDIVSTQPNVTGKRHGAGRYGEIVFKRIVERRLPLYVYLDRSKWLNPEIEALIINNNFVCCDKSSMSLEAFVKEHNIELVYTPLADDDMLQFNACNVLGTIHGLRILETPTDDFYWKYKDVRWKNRIRFLLQKYLPEIGYRKAMHQIESLKSCTNFTFVTVSNHTCASIKSFFPTFKDVDIPVFYSPSTSSNREITRKGCDKYFMLVSANRWEKNNLRAIIALDRLFSAGFLENFSVKVTGAKDSTMFKYSIKNPERFVFTGYIDDEELEQLYHDAYCLIYPSLNEGFGYPPLEAMHYGVPVLASPFSSITEVCEGAVLYFNPFSIEEMMNRIIQVLNVDKHTEMSQSSLEQYSKITRKQKEDLESLINYIYKL